MPADVKNLVCWPEGSRECWVKKLKACDHSPKPTAPGMMSHCRRVTRTLAVTSRQWSYVRTASAVRLTRKRRGRRQSGGWEISWGRGQRIQSILFKMFQFCPKPRDIWCGNYSCIIIFIFHERHLQCKHLQRKKRFRFYKDISNKLI